MSGPGAGDALLRACCLLCLVAGSRQLSIEEFSVPKAVEIGSDAELRCQYKLTGDEKEESMYVKWWWQPDPTSTEDRRQLYQRIAGHPAEQLHHSNASKIEIKDNDTIVLTNVTPVDSGIYECEVSNITSEDKKRDKLVVFNMGSGPQVNATEADHSVTIECHAEDVAPRPEMIVTLNGREINVTTAIEDEDHNGLYTIFANATLSTTDMEESDVRCEVFYSDDDIAHPPYVDAITFVPAGCESQSTTEMPEDTTELEATPESLQNPRDDGVRLHCSWILPTIAVIFTHLQAIL